MISIVKRVIKARQRHLLIAIATAGSTVFQLVIANWTAAGVMLASLAVVATIMYCTRHQTPNAQRYLFQRSLEASSNGVLIAKARWPELPIVYANPAFTQITGYPLAEIQGQSCCFLKGAETNPEQVASIRQALQNGEGISLTLRNYRKDGRAFWNNLFISPVHDHNGKITHFIGILNDISAHKHQENQLAFHATHDPLTGLGNRALFEDHLRHDSELAKRHAQQIAVLFIDLDEFKPINDTLGHSVGDKVLISVAQRLQAQIRPSDTLCRFGGDEFLLLLPDLVTTDQTEEIAHRLLASVSMPYHIDGHELHLSASIGIAVSHLELTEPCTLIQQADMAMYKAKRQGRNAVQRFTDDINTKLVQRVTLRNELHDVISKAQLDLYYQPLIKNDGTLKGFEALLRWQHPEKGMISPFHFIPLAEQTGQIVALGQWVLERVARDLATLAPRMPSTCRIAINLSPLQFHRPDFLTGLTQTLQTTGLPAQQLEVELTESILMKDAKSAIERLNALRELGVSIAIDDFGTGFSSLNYLRHLPIDTLKIDRSFVTQLPENSKDAAVVNGIIGLAHNLGLTVVAEGIEHEQQHHALRQLNCDAFQGYLFARPMPLASLTEWLDHRQR
ncbi:MAG: putative bifunctional diguanylate cyclase/phosphodiesterase [Pseudomonadota bacterium]